MKRKSFVAILWLFAVLLGGGFTWRFTYANAGWHIRQVFPGAQPYFDPVSSPDLTFSELTRMAVPTYVDVDESVGFSLADSSEPLDLQQRFSRLSHLHFFGVRLTRCHITNLCPAGTRGFPSVIVFDDCDFSRLPAEQRSQLRPYDPSNPAAAKQFFIGGV